MRTTIRISTFAFALTSQLSCSSTTPGGAGTPRPTDGGTEASSDDGATGPESESRDAAPVVVAIPCTDPIDSIYGDPGALTGDRGTILRCATDRALDKNAADAFARSNHYTGRPLTSGVHAFRISYRTERISTALTDGSTSALSFSSALVLVPDAPRSGQLPVVVAAHGTVGQGGRCTPTKGALEAMGSDFTLLFSTLAADGYAVIAPDYAGYANYEAMDNPASGYASSDDEGRSVLDAARALRNLIPQSVSDKVVLVGHSQGGHSVLSALALHETYGSGGTLAGVVAYSPLWFNQSAWGAMLLLPFLFPIHDNHFLISVGLWYHYSHGELLDGPGHGVDVFAPSARATIKTFFDDNCINDDKSVLDGLGQTVGDLYDPTFSMAVGAPAATGAACPADANQALCEKWQGRYASDRPHLAGAATHVPLLILYGSADTTIPPERAMCGFDRVKADGAMATICVNQGATHGGIVAERADYVNDWIAEKALGEAAPAACERDESSLGATCATPPPN